MPINQTREILENIFNGTSPVKRSNPEPGESAYYYLQPDANASTVNQMQRIDIQNSNIQSQHLGKFDDDIIKKTNPFFTNFNNWVKENKQTLPLRLSDENKHQYMSCLASKGNLPMLTAGIITAAGKEIADITVKSLDKQQYQRYHGFKNIVKDSLKDMHNNGIGWRYGLAPDSDCQSLLYHKL